jgi:hypothetical protein
MVYYENLYSKRILVNLGTQIKQAAKQEKEELQAMNLHHPILDKTINYIENNIDQPLRRFVD